MSTVGRGLGTRQEPVVVLEKLPEDVTGSIILFNLFLEIERYVLSYDSGYSK